MTDKLMRRERITEQRRPRAWILPQFISSSPRMCTGTGQRAHQVFLAGDLPAPIDQMPHFAGQSLRLVGAVQRETFQIASLAVHPGALHGNQSAAQLPVCVLHLV